MPKLPHALFTLARDLPIDDEPAGIHVVVDGAHYSNGCCFNYGNASTNGLAVGTGTMESVYFGTSTGAAVRAQARGSCRTWLDFPAGTTNLPVHSAEGFAVGEKISIDLGGNTEIATVTSVDRAATQTTLAASTTRGATNIKLTALANLSVSDTLTISTGQRMERAVVASIGTAGPQGSGVVLTAPLKFAHTSGVDVWGRGTGISFEPATRFAHRSGDAGITLTTPLARAHYGGAVVTTDLPTPGAANKYSNPRAAC